MLCWLGVANRSQLKTITHKTASSRNFKIKKDKENITMGRIANEVPDVLKQDEVTIDQILVDDTKNMRLYPISEKETKELAADILANGLLQPVLVRPSTSDGAYKYELVAGYRRYHAIECLITEGNHMTVLVRVIEAEDQGAAIANIAENLKRKDASVIELSHAIGKLKDGESVKDEGTGEVTVVRPAMTLRDISQSLGVSLGNVSEIERMRNLRAPIQKKVHNGDYSRDFARHLIKLTEEEQDKEIAKVDSGETTQYSLTSAAKAKKKGRSGKKRRGKGGDAEGADTTKKPLSSKAAILVIDELCDVPKAGEGDEAAAPQVESDVVRGILAQFGRFLGGKIGAKALVNQISKLVE